MSQTQDYPYVTKLDIAFQPLELVDVNKIAAESPHQWFNQSLCEVNSSVVRVGVVQGEYHWHKHTDDDEFFFVVSGTLFVDLEDRTFELKPGQGVVVPKNVVHRTRAHERTVMLMVENRGIIPTGN